MKVSWPPKAIHRNLQSSRLHALTNLFRRQSSPEKDGQEHPGFHAAEVASEHGAHFHEIVAAAATGVSGRDPALGNARCDRDPKCHA